MAIVRALAAAFFVASVAHAQILPLKDVRAGMHGIGRTIFSGNKIEDFQVDILGILDNTGPKESLIIARLSGGPLEHTGVMQGMSGSPVYIDGKLIGAVAMAFPFAKDPIAGIRPIEDMLRAAGAAPPQPAPAPPPRRNRLALIDGNLSGIFAPSEPVMAGSARMVDIATPMSFGGFTRATLEYFTPQLRALGLEPMQGVSAGGKLSDALGNPADLHPGSMISVEMLSGDLTVGADGTVTYIDGSRIYAFGHRFLDIGQTSLPFARAEVLTSLANVNTSFKLSAAKEWMGVINQDRSATVAGELGKRSDLVPVSFTVAGSGRAPETYNMRMVDDSLLSPLLLQMAAFSVIDRTERTLGASTLRISGEIEFRNGPAPIRLDNMFSADTGTAAIASMSAAVPAAYVMQSSFDALRLSKVNVRIETIDKKRLVNIDNITASKHEVRPGDSIMLSVLLAGENGAETRRQVEYKVPIGALPGPLYFTISDATTANITDFRQILGANPRTTAQLIETVNGLHPNTKAYIRVWRADPAFQLEGADFPAPPASVAMVFEAAQSTQPNITQSRNSKIAEMEIDGGGSVISGAKTIQVEIKE